MPIKANCIYFSGASPSAECLACGATSTTASWRRGWELPGGRGHVCLCNRCGQRWHKAGRPDSLEGLQEAERRKAARAGTAGGSHAAPPTSAGAKRPAPPSPQPPPGTGVAFGARPSASLAKHPRLLAFQLPVRPRRRLSSGESSPSSSSADTPTQDRSDSPGSSASLPKAGPTTASPWQWLQQHPQQTPATQQQQLPAAAGAANGCFVSYCIQKLSSGRAAHAAFWLQDAAGESVLAVVGTDARLSGHFTYATTPAFLELGVAPALRCTNRTEVQAWLASFGCTEQVAEGSVRLPELSAEQRRRVLNPEEPVWARPAALSGTFHGVREESGRLADGRHFKRFWLLGLGGVEKLVVSGVDSSRKDRRYKYFAEDDMGGFAFENAREVMAWVNFALSRPADAPLEPEQTRCPHPLKEEELGSLIARIKAAAQQERQPPPPPPGRASPAGGLSAGNAAAARAAPARSPAVMSPAAALAVQAGRAASPYSTSLAGKVRPVRSQQLLGGSAENSPSPSTATARAGAPAEGWAGQHGSMAAAAAAAHPLQQPAPPLDNPLPKLELACCTCGAAGHASEDCLAALLSPPSLIRTADGGAAAHCAHTRTLSLLLDSSLPSPAGSLARHLSRHLSGAFHLAGASGLRRQRGAGASSAEQLDDSEEGSWQTPLASPQLLSHEQLRAALHAEAAALEPAASARTVSQQLQLALSHDPQLLTWVSSLPSAATRDTFARWADKLSSHVSDVPPPLPTCADDTPVRGWSWCPTYEALAILSELSAVPVNLSLLQTTGISAAVAQLRNHRNRDICASAEAIVAKWRQAAVAALEHATR